MNKDKAYIPPARTARTLLEEALSLYEKCVRIDVLPYLPPGVKETAEESLTQTIASLHSLADSAYWKNKVEGNLVYGYEVVREILRSGLHRWKEDTAKNLSKEVSRLPGIGPSRLIGLLHNLPEWSDELSDIMETPENYKEASIYKWDNPSLKAVRKWAKPWYIGPVQRGQEHEEFGYYMRTQFACLALEQNES